MLQRKIRDIATAHRFPVALPDDALGIRDQAIMLRYDGKAHEVEDRIFVVIPITDLAKLPQNSFSLDEADLDGHKAFFRETPSGVSLYLDADANTALIANMKESVRRGEIALIDCVGDLRVMGGPDNIVAPVEAAYEQNDFPEVSAATGLSLLRDLIAKKWDLRDEHSPLSP